MNSLIESLNVWGARFVDFALPILWQSSLLIVVIFAVDLLLRRKIRPAVRYTLWFVVFIKLLIPPTLALPTSAAWWLRTRKVQIIAPQPRTMTVSYREPVATFVPSHAPMVHYSPPPPQLSREAWLLLSTICVSALLGAWSVFRWRQITRCVRKTTAAGGEIQELFAEIRSRAGVRKIVRLRLTGESMSPAVCGLFRPVVLLPQSLIERLERNQLRAVLLHELIHLRRRDVWVNCAQTILQIVYWWHPLLWFANARIRRVREEAVDDAVMFALSDEAEIYAPTLLEVAKLAFNRPLATLGLVGILESRNALRHRIERLLNFSAPRRVGVSVMSVLGIAAFTALAVPMGEPPARPLQGGDQSDAGKLVTFHGKVDPEIFMRNVKARAAGTMHTTNDDLNDILASILDGFGVDCAPPRNPAFDATTGDVTLQNTPEAMNLVDSVIRELNLPGGESILNPPYGLKQVLIVAQFYRMQPDAFAKLNLDSNRSHHEPDMSPWWDLSTNELDEFRQEISHVRAEHISSPRIQTSHGVTADLSIGDKTNGIELECVPYIRDGFIILTALARTSGNYAPEGGWPDFAGHTNCAIFSRFEIPDGGAVVLRAEHAGTTAASDLVILLRATTLVPTSSKAVPFLGNVAEPSRSTLPLTGNLPTPRGMAHETDKIPILGDLPGVGRLFRSESNGTTMAGATNLHSFIYHFDRATVEQLLTKFGAEHNMAGSTNWPLLMHKYLENAGVDLNPPKSFFYGDSGFLALHAGEADLQKTAVALGLNKSAEPVSAAPALVGQLVQDGKLLYQQGKYDEAEAKLNGALAIQPDNQAALYYLSLIKQVKVRGAVDARNLQSNSRTPVPNPYARTNTIYTSPQRQKLYEKLTNITFDKVVFARLQLTEVVRNLAEITQRRDIDQQGINFILSRIKPAAVASPTGQPQAFDPTTGQPIATPAATPIEDVDLGAVEITLDPGLRNVRLLDVLEAIVKSSDHPIKYSLLDYGIEFSFKGPDVLELHTRTFKLDPNTFYMGLQNVGVLSVPKSGSGNGSNSGTSAPPNATVSTNRGLRYVTGLDPHTEIQIAVINFFSAIGVNLAAPKSVFFNDRQGTLTVHATDEDLELIEQAINTLNMAPPEVTTKVRFVEADEEFLTALFTTSPGVWTNSSLKGILTEPQLKTVLKTLEKREHAELLNEGEVTTLSGRQANFQVIDVKTILFGVNATETNQATTSGYAMTNMPFGTTLDVVATVAADGYTIQMTVAPVVTEFLGYEDPKDLVKYDKNLKDAHVSLPKIRVRQMNTSAIVWDGQTLVLGNLSDESLVTEPNGTGLRQPFDDKKKKRLIIFITPTIIDPSGNRVHSVSKDYYDGSRTMALP